jgi:hypothetical protein
MLEVAEPLLFEVEKQPPSLPRLERHELVPAREPCAYHFTFRKVALWLGAPERCGHRAYLFHVNHLLLSLCICHARQYSARAGVNVSPLRDPDYAASCAVWKSSGQFLRRTLYLCRHATRSPSARPKRWKKR